MARPPVSKTIRGVVAVIANEGRLLLIRRSAQVRAPRMYCFPGGQIEPGEEEEQTLRREVREELAVEVLPIGRIWTSVTSWGVELAWWQAELPPDCQPVANPDEVESWQWCTVAQMRAIADLLPSNGAFLDALADGVFTLPGMEHVS